MNRYLLALLAPALLWPAVYPALAKDPKGAKDEPLVWKAVPPGGSKKLERLDPKSFEQVQLTNQIDPVWTKPPTNLFTLGPGDLIDIENLNEPARLVTSVVGPDGKIYYSLLPGMSVWGMTLMDAKLALENSMQKYFKAPPDLAVNLKLVRSQNAWILGNVTKPGLYPLQMPMTILEGITYAGGTVFVPGSEEGVCDLERSFVMRNGQPLPIDFERLLRGGDLSQNIYLRPDDFVYLRSATIRNVYVLGAVAVPRVVAYNHKISLGGAVISAGGLAEYAYKTDVAIIRGSLVTPRVAKVDIGAILKGKARDIELEPGDIVYIPYAPWRKAAIMVDSMVRNFVRTIAINEGYRATVPGGYTTSPIISPSSSPSPVIFNPDRGY
jgi:polysaccharide biosynthesis/export protein